MDEELRGRVAREVRAELARQKITGAELARALRMPQTTVARRLAGTYDFSVPELQAIATHLGVPLSQFLDEQVGAA